MTPLFPGPKSAPAEEYRLSSITLSNSPKAPFNFLKIAIDFLNPATHSPRAFAYRWIDSIQAIDKYTLKIRLKEPFAPFLTTLTIQNCPIIPARWEPTPMKLGPGTRPFVFKSFVPNETCEMTRFDRAP